MAGATYLCRAGGYWVFSRLPPSRTIQATLAHLPGCLFVAYVAPALLRGQLKDVAGAAATVIAMKLSGNIGVAIGVGMATAWTAYAVARAGF